MSLDEYRQKYFNWYKNQKNTDNIIRQSHQMFGQHFGLPQISDKINDNVNMDGDPMGFGEDYYKSERESTFKNFENYFREIFKNKKFLSLQDIEKIDNIYHNDALKKVYLQTRTDETTWKNYLRNLYDTDTIKGTEELIKNPLWKSYFKFNIRTEHGRKMVKRSLKEFKNHVDYLTDKEYHSDDDEIDKRRKYRRLKYKLNRGILTQQTQRILLRRLENAGMIISSEKDPNWDSGYET